MAGIQSLMQTPMPGQAPTQQMPGLMPQQGAATPASMLAPLKGHSSDQLKMMVAQRPSWVLLTAYNDALKREALEREGLGQQAQMAAASTQGRTVKDDILAQPVMAAHGGEMHGYAGGGAVAFQSGASPQGLPFPASPARIDVGGDFPIYALGPDKAPGESDAAYEARKQKEALEADEVANRPLRRLYRYLAEKVREPSAVAQMRTSVAQTGTPTPAATSAATSAAPSGIAQMTPQQRERFTPPMMVAPPAPDKGALTGEQRRQPVVPAPTPITGLPELSAEQKAQKALDLTQSEKLAAERAALVEKLSKASPEVLAARETLQRVLGSAYDPQKKTLEEAKDLYARGIGSNAEALGRMAAAVGGSKRFGQGLAAAAGAGAQFVGEQRKRVEDLTDKYNTLKSQLDITMAQAVHADAIGDDKLKREALMKAEDIKAELFNTQRGIRKEYFGEQVQQATGIAALRKAGADELTARAHMISAGKPTEMQQRVDLYRKDPHAYEAMFGPKESAATANLIRAVNSDPALKSLAEGLKLGTPEAEARYNARYKALVAMHAPELLLGAGGDAGGGGALEAATAIARGGKQ